MAKVDTAGEVDSAPTAASPTPTLPKAPVEARSLSSITAIASNPPAYPRNPTQKKLDPLVLYIVRVPGSRDVFLTPLKPPTKSNVSAEAINASLYYLHVATPDDDVLLQEYEQEHEEEARLRKETLGSDADSILPAREFARLNNVRRKPVPGAGDAASATKVDATVAPARPRPTSWQSQGSLPSSPSLQRPPMPPRPSFQGPPPEYTPSTPPFAPVNRDPFDATAPNDARPSRPLPPVPRDEPVLGPPLDPMPKKANRWSAALSGYIARGQESWRDKIEAGRPSLDSQRPQIRPDIRPHSAHGSPSHSYLGSPSRSPGRGPARSPGQSPSLRPHDRMPDRPGFHLTLIRRDPTHGSQWNVATMSTPRMDGGPIDIEVLTPGYNRFTAQNEPISLASLGVNLPGGQPISLSSFKRPEVTDPPTSTPNEPHPRRFHRKLCVSRPYFQEEPRGSLDLTGRPSLDSIGGGSPTKPHVPSHSKLKSGYYTFNSPWNGICTFTTSVNGRSLKCKHMIPTPGFPSTSHHHTPTSMPEPPAITAAEIRFNTPFRTGHLHQPSGAPYISPSYHPASPPTEFSLSSPTSTSGIPSSKRDSLARFLNAHKYTRPRARSGASISSGDIGTSHHTRNASNSSTSSGGDEEREKSGLLRRPPSDDRLDLSLARERAGGGMRGKSAKMGKLIIEDEGIKMLDLVVAACMAVYTVSC
ncbi:hypothetical protein BO94DRAFT_570254 [Aspergillus sclerotioniger CBS 115572]|uniref:Uncharacterized protein n=1 Tax=Aspergillus sclerotioniger CBS 115572 TaxID=1450535 RepID=A0A317UYG5_9EURO|nr:hypothetical protein BO94DRAFT_570254 [Aspergillus sclerotioniger CBS 115572]PWY66399.1 hypothetical protein BO94DRAFT_570254 [Aspergillus sclerotioniger CBS 115572]